MYILLEQNFKKKRSMALKGFSQLSPEREMASKSDGANSISNIPFRMINTMFVI